MRRILALVLAVLLVVTLPVRSVEGGSTSFAGIAPLQGNGRTFCTAFAIAKDMWASAAHCGDYALHLRSDGVQISIGGTYAELTGMDGIWDLAVFHSAYKGFTFQMSDTEPHVGDAVEVRGFPYGLGPAVTFGHIAALNVPIEGYHMSNILDLTVAGGNSGSPVLSAHGKVIGVLWGAFTDSPHSLAVPFEPTIRFLKPYTE